MSYALTIVTGAVWDLGLHSPESIPILQPDPCIHSPIFIATQTDASPPHPKILPVPPQQKMVRKPYIFHSLLLVRNEPNIRLGSIQNL